MPDMTPLPSSTVRAIGHDPDSGELHVRFDNGTYVYAGVPAALFQGMHLANSPGAFLHKMIKGKYPARKIA